MESPDKVPLMAAPAVGLEPRQQRWEKIDWTSSHQRSIFRSWAQHFAHTGVNKTAMKYFDKSVSKDPATLCMRSQFNRAMARPEAALDDSKRAQKYVGPWNTKVNIQQADALYNLNQFEKNKLLLHNNLRVQVGTSKLPFEKRLMIVKENFKHTVGDSLRPFSLKNSSIMCRSIHESIKQNQKTDWKLLNMRKDCDILSIIESEEIPISPLQRARSQCKTRIYFQTYLKRAWTDVVFLKQLRNNPIVLLDKYSSNMHDRKQEMCRSYDSVKKFTRMLHARSPMYNERHKRETSISQRFHQDVLLRFQYQTRRSVFSILRNIQTFRKHNDVERLRDYVSIMMGDYNVLKTIRLLPWKMEFMNEVYNHVALSLCETYQLPNERVSPYDTESMCRLLDVMPLKPTKQGEPIFGVRSSFADENTVKIQEQAKAFKRTKIFLENRLYSATKRIERSYLYYELADAYLGQHQQEFCLSYAKKAMDEAKLCNSTIWQFLATMLQAKSHAILCKLERQAEVLNEAYVLAMSLKSPRLCTFIELCRMLNRDYISLRKMTRLISINKRKRNRVSIRFSSSQNTSDSELDTYS